VTNGSEYVRGNPAGAMSVGEAGVALESVLVAWGQGHSPETIRSQFPALTLEEVYGAITWSLSHRAEAESYLKRQNQLWQDWQIRSDATNSPLRHRLNAARTATTA
jgi:uncharacterized protein (DUF433 family)